jgi:hypothetical protein
VLVYLSNKVEDRSSKLEAALAQSSLHATQSMEYRTKVMEVENLLKQSEEDKDERIAELQALLLHTTEVESLKSQELQTKLHQAEEFVRVLVDSMSIYFPSVSLCILVLTFH